MYLFEFMLAMCKEPFPLCCHWTMSAYLLVYTEGMSDAPSHSASTFLVITYNEHVSLAVNYRYMFDRIFSVHLFVIPIDCICWVILGCKYSSYICLSLDILVCHFPFANYILLKSINISCCHWDLKVDNMWINSYWSFHHWFDYYGNNLNMATLHFFLFIAIAPCL